MAHLTEKTADLKARAAALVAHCRSLEQRIVEREREVRELSTRILMAPRIQSILEATQARAHSRAVGAYEAILTGLIHDVLGERAGQARLTASQRVGHPALDIDIVKPDGVEDIMDGNGGALTNIVCAGLRFAAVARSGLRKFIVLDEPDCWLKPELVPVFFRSIAAVCDQAGFQAVVVSHHGISASELPETTSFIKLTVSEDGVPAVSCELSGAVGPEALSYLWLKQFRCHQDTLVEFGPGLTILSGPNNAGKSAIVSALRAIAHGGASDSQIMHGADELFCELGFNRGGQQERIALTRKRNGSPRVVLQHLNAADEELHAERGTPSAAPEWVTSLLGISELEGIDPQLLNQKTPIFLLNQPPSTRAKLLYAGREAAHLARMFEEQNRQLREDRRTLERTRTELNALMDVHSVVAQAPAALSQAETLVSTARNIEALNAKTRNAEAILPRMRAAAQKAALDVARARLPVPPSLHDVSRLQQKLARIRALHVAAANRPPQLPDAPMLNPTTAVLATGRKLRALTQVTDVLTRLPTLTPAPDLRDTRPLVEASRAIARRTQLVATLARLPQLPPLPEVKDTSRLHAQLVRHQEADRRARALAVELKHLMDALSAADAELSTLVEQAGHTCPICHQGITKEHLHAY